ncbi:hypothetical protein FB446DRAFT_760687 [Lentinula raphanica]|nr:hypothetical protein FB446DRAFT_760687 [Lentinula raphanica]
MRFKYFALSFMISALRPSSSQAPGTSSPEPSCGTSFEISECASLYFSAFDLSLSLSRDIYTSAKKKKKDERGERLV